MSYSVLTDCDNCLHDRICNMKNRFLDVQQHVRSQLVCSEPEVQVSVKCQQFFSKNQPVFRNDLTIEAYPLSERPIEYRRKEMENLVELD